MNSEDTDGNISIFLELRYMKKASVLVFGILLSMVSFSQTVLSGKVTDTNTGEALIGATVIYGKGQGTATDFDGNY
jgi:prepilin signal peptidase PulO-like enzyme (type II secretory pathway)